MRNVNEEAFDIYTRNRAKGFWDECERIPTRMLFAGMETDEIMAVKRAFKMQKLMLTVSELSEALEALRKDHYAPEMLCVGSVEHTLAIENDDEFKAEFEKHVKNTYEDELTDAYIRILDQAGGFEIDLDSHIKAKLRYNALRPYKHGKNS